MCVMVIVGLPPICWKFTDFRVCPNTSTSSLGVWSSTSITIHSDHTSSWFEQNPLCHSVLSWEKYISPPVLRRWSWSSLHKDTNERRATYWDSGTKTWISTGFSRTGASPRHPSSFSPWPGPPPSFWQNPIQHRCRDLSRRLLWCLNCLVPCGPCNQDADSAPCPA